MTHDCPSPALAPPREFLGGYRLLQKLGEGASSHVYEAVHVALGKHVAIKILKRELAADDLAVERMRFEAQALARLNHPNILTVSDFGRTADGRPFFVMERLHGVSLFDELRRRGCLPVSEAVELVQQVLAGLEAAHALGLVHRDIKLENLYLCTDGDGRRTVKILDFGIAKALPGAAAAGAPEPPAIPSHEGLPLGTPQFLSPEQALCRPVSPRTDVYGTSLVLYELIAGRDPFHHREGYIEVLQAHVSEAPRPPSAIAPQPVEPAIDDVILRALEKRPEDRWESAAEFSAALSRAVAVRPAGAATSGRPSRRRRALVSVVVVLVAAVTSAALTILLSRIS